MIPTRTFTGPLIAILLGSLCLFSFTTCERVGVDTSRTGSTDENIKNEEQPEELQIIITNNNSHDLHRNSSHRYLNSSTQTRIIGGTVATAGEYPWFARGTWNNHQKWLGCGGMLVTPEFVLTAGHCIGAGFAGGFMIGALCSPYTDSDNCDQPVEWFSVQKSFKHPEYKENNDPFSIENDFALVKLDGSSTITPVEMDKGHYSPKYATGKELWTAGFGKTSTNVSNYPTKLREVEVNYQTNAECYFSVSNDMMCAAAPGKDACNGDSGGPLYDKANNVLVGLVSWGMAGACADSRYPGVYARIADQWAWIRQTICNNHTPSTKPDFCAPSEAPTSSPSFSPSTSSSPTASFNPSTSPSTSPPSFKPSTSPSKPPTSSPIKPPPTPKPPSQATLTINVKTDLRRDYYWLLKRRNKAGKFLTVKKRYNFVRNTFHTNNYKYPLNSCFIFTMYDRFGDGFTKGQGGFFTVLWKGK